MILTDRWLSFQAPKRLRISWIHRCHPYKSRSYGSGRRSEIKEKNKSGGGGKGNVTTKNVLVSEAEESEGCLRS